MKLKEKSVECIGNISEVTLWIIDIPSNFPFISFGKFGGSILGNDAIIVSKYLLTQGYSIKCQLLDPTYEDIDSAINILGANTIIIVGGSSTKSLTRSLCIESLSGTRSWVFSRRLNLQAPLYHTSAEIIYIDYYPELQAYLDNQLKYIVNTKQTVYFNLSTFNNSIPNLPIKPTVVQVSCSSGIDQEEASVLALRLLKQTKSDKVVVTLAKNGAVLAKDGISWHCKPSVNLNGIILGAGALFSSEMIIGLLNGYDNAILLEWAVGNTAKKLGDISKL